MAWHTLQLISNIFEFRKKRNNLSSLTFLFFRFLLQLRCLRPTKLEIVHLEAQNLSIETRSGRASLRRYGVKFCNNSGLQAGVLSISSALTKGRHF